MATAEPHVYEAVTAVFSCADHEFTAKGKAVIAAGWKEIERLYRATLKKKPDSDDENELVLDVPDFSEGQTFENPAAKVTEHATTPPKPHNEASLLSAMERAGNEDTDPDAERRGLGTPATRAAVIEKLVKGGFVERKGKQLFPTKDGTNLVCVLPDSLTSPQLTAAWENNLTQIAKGNADPAAFMQGIEAMAQELVKTYASVLGEKQELFKTEKTEIATAVLPLFAGNDQYEVMSCEVTENRLYLKVVNHRLEMEVRKGDIVQAGVMISNSEVGLGAVSIQPLVYRLVCTNGMVVNDMGERRHHVGRQAKAVEDSFALYSDETMEAEDKAFLLKLRDTTMAAIDEACFSQVVGRLQESMAVPITGKVQDVVQLTAQSYGINAEEQEGILKYLIEGGDLSLYGLSNAVTRASQDVVSYDRATTLEGIGWQVATMEPQQWKQINQ